MNNEKYEYQYLTEQGKENLKGKVVDALELVSMIDGLVEKGSLKNENSEVMAEAIIDLISSHTIDLKHSLGIYVDNLLE